MKENTTLQDWFLGLETCKNQGITFVKSSYDDVFVPYEELFKSAREILGTLQEIGLKPGDELVFQLQQTQVFVETFWACVLGKIIPVPVNFAVSNELRAKLSNIIKLLNSPYLITTRNNYSKNLSLDKNLNDLIDSKIIISDDIKRNRIGEVKRATADDIAYVQFSSGSTGNPKGVLLTHRNLVANVNSIHAGIDSPIEGDRFFSWMPLTHDMGLIGFHLTPLAASWGHYIMPTELFMRNPSLWLRKISEYKITFSSSPNFGYQYLLKHFNPEKNSKIDLASLRMIVNGAEPISLDICQRFIEYFKNYGLKKNVIFPVYGLAEASLAVSFSDPEEEILSVKVNRNKLNIGNEICYLKEGNSCVEFVSVGKPVLNSFLRLVDEGGDVLGLNLVGEIQIKGDNVTCGYYNNDRATSELVTKDGWCNTGDLGFMDVEGRLYVVGRVKDIIFVNGGNFYSHDLERVLEKVDGIELGKLVITAGFHPNLFRDEILLFILYRGNLEGFVSIAEECRRVISEEIGINLDRIIPVRNIPKTTSGKIQRFRLLQKYFNGEFQNIVKELDSLGKDVCKHITVSHEDTNEDKILKIWQEVLCRNDFGVNDDFFVVGGNSLMAGQVVMCLQEKFNMDLSIEDIYRYRTIKALSQITVNEISKGGHENYQYQRDVLGLSHAQNRIFYHYHLNPNSTAYNISLAFTVEGKVDLNKLKISFKELVKRYDILRTTFHLQGDSAYQQIHKNPIALIEEVEINADGNLDDQIVKLISPFQLESLPLIRLKYGSLGVDRIVLLLDVHHIVADGTSIVKLIDELFKIYSGEELQENREQYCDYVAWEEEFLKSEQSYVQRGYWSKQLRNPIPKLQLPFDFNGLKRGEGDEGARYFGKLGNGINKALQKLSAQLGIPKSVFLFSAYSLLLHKLSGQGDIIIGVAEAGRNQVRFSDSVGMFVNNLPFRVLLSGKESIERFYSHIHQQFIETLKSKAIPFNELLKFIDYKGGQDRNPLFDTMFVYQNMEFPQLVFEEFSIAHYPFDSKVSKFDLALEILEDKELSYSFEYSTLLFEKETISRFSYYLEVIVRTIIEAPNTLIKDIDVLSNIEKAELLVEFNETKSDYPDILVHDLFAKQVKQTPEAYAIISGEELVTYKELDEKIDNLACVIIEKGIQIEDFVAILLNPSVEFVVSVFAVLRAGGAYVPIDTSYPLSRKQYIIEDSGAKIVLTSKPLEQINVELFSNISRDKIVDVEEKIDCNS
jgi:acyl-CoA synthetase (AMP-forming)/AMP-acid ligase II/acyl carrier protein